MAKIKYVKGDATAPKGTDNRLIIHCCNDIGGWGSGFVLAISKRWKAPEQEYRSWHARNKKFELGNIQIVPVAENLAVANMIGQRGIWKRTTDSEPPIRYWAIQDALKKVYHYCNDNNVSVHAPKFGADRAGGDWPTIENLINIELVDKGIDVTIYEYEPK